MSERTIVVVTAGLSQPSSTRMLADRLAEAATTALADRGVVGRIEVVEVREYAHAIIDSLLIGFADARLSTVLAAVTGADALIVVSPTLNASYSGLFKAFIDVIDEGVLAGKPVLLGATGGSVRHSLVTEHGLRPLFSYLRAVVLPTAVYAAAEDWGAATTSVGRLADRIARAGAELADGLTRPAAGEAGRLQQLEPAPGKKPRVGSADPFVDPVEFTDLLAAVADGRVAESPLPERGVQR